LSEVSEINGKIIENPGFPVRFHIPSGKKLVITIENILSFLLYSLSMIIRMFHITLFIRMNEL
jgi:hypothetical protein